MINENKIIRNAAINEIEIELIDISKKVEKLSWFKLCNDKFIRISTGIINPNMIGIRQMDNKIIFCLKLISSNLFSKEETLGSLNF